MPPKTINLRPMGADAADAAAAREKVEKKAAAHVAAISKEACIECGQFGPWCDGDFYYCSEHVADELRHRGAHWREGRS